MLLLSPRVMLLDTITQEEETKHIKRIRRKYHLIKLHLNERTRCLWVATEAKVLDYSGVAVVKKATGMAKSTIHGGPSELEHPETVASPDHIRRPGGGKRKITEEEMESTQAHTGIVSWRMELPSRAESGS